MAERLDAFLSRRGFGSRSEARQLVRRSRVNVAGAVCRDFARHLNGDEVSVDGVPVATGAISATLLVHKPVGYACSHDPGEAPLLEELIPAAFGHLALESAGRLDRDTSGLIVVTSEGDLIHALTNPRRHLEKRYRVVYRGVLSRHAVERCAKGLLLDGDPRPTLPARLELGPEAGDGVFTATMFLTEGRFHQVRLMFAELGGEVVNLHRDRIGGLDLPADLALGQAREITEEERKRMMG
jgi:16S rRNA pseudouridine516 synthase